MNIRDVRSMAPFVAAGGLAGIAFHGYWICAWLGLAVFAVAIAGTQSKLPLIIGSYLGGLLFNIIALDWMFQIADPVLPLALVHTMAIAWPVTALLIGQLAVPLNWGFPVAWTIGTAAPVWLTTFAFGPPGHFYLNRLAQTQLDVPPVQVADLAGMAGVEFVMAATAAGIAEWVMFRHRSVAFVVLVMASYVYGSLRMMHEPERHLRIELHSERFGSSMESRAEVDLSVWPEEACRRDWDTADWTKFVDVLGSPVVSGFCRKVGPQRYNSVAVADDAHVEYYDKHFMVLGGETPSPFQSIEQVNYRYEFNSVGDRPRLLRCNDLLLAVPICYEVAIPRAITGRPDIIINPGSELRLRNGMGTLAMLNQARLRAIESRRSVVRAVVSGQTAIVDGSGRIIAARVNETLVGDVPLDRRWSLFGNVGDCVTAASCVLAGALIVRSILGRVQNRGAK